MGRDLLDAGRKEGTVRQIKTSLAAIALLLFASPIFAQTPVVPVQTDLIPVLGPALSFSRVEPPTKAGDMLFFYGEIASGAVLSDSQGNTWLQVNADYNQWFFVPASAGGPETFTITYPAGQSNIMTGIYYEFAGSYVIGDVIPPRSATNPGQSLRYVSDTTNPCSFPLTTSYANELVIGINNSNTMAQFSASQITGETGWALGAFIHNDAAQATMVATPATVQSCFTQPMIPSTVDINLGIAGFKPVALPVTNTVTLSLNFTYEDGTAPTIWSVSVTDTTANVSYPTLTPSPASSVTFPLTSTDTYSFTLSIAGAPVITLPYQGSSVLALFPSLSQVTGTVVLCKTTCTVGAIKSASWTEQ
jgi:hypothetical protein